MEEKYIIKIAEELKIKPKQAEAAALLLADNATVPFIARYRKEVTGSLDEVAITSIRDRLEQLSELDKRRQAIVESLVKQEKLTDELKAKIMAAETMNVLEDIYLPFRPKRRTRATIAKEKGLEPLAKMLFNQEDINPTKEAKKFINPQKKVNSAEEAIAGSRDIIAEWISEDQQARAQIRTLFQKHSRFSCKVITGKEQEAIKYKDYYDYQEPVISAPPHRVHAIRRGSKEKFLLFRVIVDEDKAVAILDSLFHKKDNPAAYHVKMAVRDGFKRLIMPSMETEIRIETKKRADEEAIKVFSENLKQLLLSPPLGEKRILAIDPGFRTGCKLVCLDSQGKLLYHETIYPLNSEAAAKKEGLKVKDLCDKYKIEAIAIGNGTAGRETVAFIRSIGLVGKIRIEMVNESGASVYSASEAAREEFPDHDITVRGAVSIGRRLMDPLAELVKIDPKSIGVGQYQHDVDQTLLKRNLDDTVISCVNAVGVEVNTASKQLLQYVSGLGPTLAGHMLKYRNENGPFKSREDLKNVSGLGDKTYEQCAGFLRIRNSTNPLDASAVHPESYGIVNCMAKDLDCSVSDLINDTQFRDKIRLEKYITETVGMPTLIDIKEELSKPGRDPRVKFEEFSFAEGIKELTDLKPGMELPGIITNITAFGAFVDIGVHQDGLIHKSELSNRFVKNPIDFVKVHQKVKVRVLSIDIARKRISLSLKEKAAIKKVDKSHKPVKKKKTPQKKQRDEKGFGERLNIKANFNS